MYRAVNDLSAPGMRVWINDYHGLPHDWRNRFGLIVEKRSRSLRVTFQEDAGNWVRESLYPEEYNLGGVPNV